MTLEEMKTSTKPLLTAADAAQALGMRVDYLRYTGIEAPEELPSIASDLGCDINSLYREEASP